jgi:phosphotransacetylase
MPPQVREATELLKKHPAILEHGIPVEGPIQFDAAVDPEIAAVKYKGKPGPVAGRANVPHPLPHRQNTRIKCYIM